ASGGRAPRPAGRARRASRRTPTAATAVLPRRRAVGRPGTRSGRPWRRGRRLRRSFPTLVQVRVGAQRPLVPVGQIALHPVALLVRRQGVELCPPPGPLAPQPLRVGGRPLGVLAAETDQ